MRGNLYAVAKKPVRTVIDGQVYLLKVRVVESFGENSFEVELMRRPTIGGVPLAASDILYAGAAPTQIIDQLNFRIPVTVAAGNQPIVISVAGVNSPPNAFVAVQP